MDLLAMATHGAFTSSITDLPELASILDTDTLDGQAGLFHAPEEAEVQAGVAFGPASALVGTYVPPDGTRSISIDLGGGMSLIKNI